MVYELFMSDESVGTPINVSDYVTPLMTYTATCIPNHYYLF